AYPGSRKFPHFNSEYLKNILADKNIEYQHLPLLGGRRTPSINSTNIAWKNSSFRGYADYMETEDFRKGIQQMEKLAEERPTAMMCSEAVWWKCHRSLVADYMKASGWKVIHIIDVNSTQEDPYTSAAKIIDGKLDYSGGQLDFLK
ncbi:MAG TPA: DUF488 domain-containing protein, partial [Cytophagaceae bacterium]